MKVTVILKGAIDSNGHQPIQIRIAHGKERTFKPTHIKVNPDQFKAGKITGHPKAEEWNKKLQTLVIQYQAQALQGFEKNIPKTNLFDYIKKSVAHLERKPETLRQYESQVNKLKEFQSIIYLDEIDHNFLNRYKSYLKGLGNGGNTVWSSFKFLRTFVRKAFKAGLIKTYPFNNYEFPKYKDPPVKHTTEKELLLIEKFIKKAPDEIKEAAIWYLIGSYSGLRLADILAFDKKKNIVNGRLIVYTSKTGEPIGLPVDGKLKKYLEMVNYKPLSIHPNTYNKFLKIIASACGIDKNLHAHISRHSAGMRWANAGIRREVIAEMLGHSDLRSTKIYAKVSNQQIDQELKKLK